MNGNPPAYRMRLAYFVLGLSIFYWLSVFDIVAPLSGPWDEILFLVTLTSLFALLGPTLWEQRRKRKSDQSA